MDSKKLQKIKNMIEKREQQKMPQKLHQATAKTMKHNIAKTTPHSQALFKDISKSHVVMYTLLKVSKIS